MKLMICHVPYDLDYDGTKSGDPCLENFLPTEVTNENGEPYSLLFGTFMGRAIPFTREELGADGFVSDVRVVFSATLPSGREGVVGWYRQANATPLPQKTEFEEENGSVSTREFFFCAVAENGVLLSEEERFHEAWAIPRCKKKTNGKFGISESGVWFAEEKEAIPFRGALISAMDSYEAENRATTDEEADC